MSMNSAVEPDSIEGVESEMPSVNERKTSAAKRGLGYLFLFAILILGLGFAYFWFVNSQQAEADAPPPADEQIASSVPSRMFDNVPPPPPEANQDPQAPAVGPLGPPVGQASTGPAAAPKPRPELDKNRSSLMIVEAEGAGQGQGGSGVTLQEALANANGLAEATGQATRDRGGLADSLSGTVTGMSSAGMLSDRNMTIAKGAMIDCVLKTRLDTTVPGMAACIVTRNIYSDNGKILLVERGSEVTGEYTAGLQQGSNRIFVLWTRLKTPNGVVIALDSPGTDSLGAAGLGGRVKHHFWRRFGAAMLLSIVDDAASFAASRNSGGDGTTVNFGGTADAASNMADTVLQKTVNIPPTLYKNQGERINIFVARDLYFGDVYELRAR